ncbi:MAG TPA: hypothetical protein DCQ26_07355 [Marinilabiliales bacterium]|jgi:hypothetical protein|nr:MAG: hypothetical protein A2W95_06660 [Bacteroidetes bacterium GWA2_40_14]OFX58712.1 MAG: hypothetical protein A2W84_19305 [Bacteroidetes bacterium GWC2_40_13]OFX71849.1 MAG: hypothetical protein A2W96_06360 [Bacteroidetes bacterium GWD2_40_43]OFX94647.1 MAG: hypothetical protein A2W97_18165 [Bacteroidetes bacterium GWE2_40_63]OFY17948.1 MAG: hypothetical protein A2W88_16300 [Bacteroidetes bacterium GWF2_40_13]OFZ24412.1 MAG: hypothetical protein A2437_18295 [Bacteroidetes bacterium RIFOXYC
MRSIVKIIAFAVFFAFILLACELRFGKKGIKEGKIIYGIEYMQEESENPLISLMPSTLEMVFKDNTVKMEVQGWMGVFKSSFIRHYPQEQSITVFKMMNKKYYYKSVGGTDFMGMSSYPNMKIHFDDKEKKIIEFNCKHVSVEIPEKSLNFDVYYTNDIRIESPNSLTPFHEIPGVMMEFQIEIHGIPMRLLAKEIIDLDVQEDVFNVPEGYMEVTKDTVDELIKELI